MVYLFLFTFEKSLLPVHSFKKTILNNWYTPFNKTILNYWYTPLNKTILNYWYTPLNKTILNNCNL